ncbi:hypothetical protein RintRC_3251 [Richelia intracellularis]|nr:hypothetical protein RintRC_3251 [Richelia intracellularis]
MADAVSAQQIQNQVVPRLSVMLKTQRKITTFRDKQAQR